MNIILMMNDIKNYCYNNDYEETLELLDKYFKLDNIGITDNILDMYIRCLINLGKIDDAKKYISLMIDIFPKYYNSYHLGIKYCQCKDIDKLREIINLNDLHNEDLYYLAKMYYYNQYYDEAIILFNKFLLESKNKHLNNKTKEYLLKIRLYSNQKDVFREESFLSFKLNGKKLEPGYVIHVDKVRYRGDINEPKHDKRPYMIWKIEGDKIYCFPITSSITKEYKYILFAKNYPHIGFDRIIKESLVCISSKDVTKVIDKIRDDDYQLVIQNIYKSICYCDDKIKLNQMFINSILKDFNIDTYDILSINDVKLKQRRLYFIIDKDIKNKQYKAIEIKYNNGEFEIVNYSINIISFEEPVLNVIKLDQDTKNKLLEKIPTNYKKVNMLGKVVQYDNHELEIMLEEDKYYLCLDRTVSYLSRDINLYFLRKDVPLFSLFRFSSDKYQTHLRMLNEYISNNYWKFAQGKQEFMLRSRIKK